MINDERPTRYDILRNGCSHMDSSVASSIRDLRREVEEKVPKYYFSKAKWDKFQESAQSFIGEVDSEDSVGN